jgi:hypothetical protein
MFTVLLVKCVYTMIITYYSSAFTGGGVANPDNFSLIRILFVSGPEQRSILHFEGQYILVGKFVETLWNF